ncbi:TPA: restriction endonuclease subunit S [Photobacterium damselae]
MTSRVKFSEIAELVMGQSPTGSDCNGTGDGIPLLNGPTEFTERSPLPVQFTTAGKKFSKVGDILFCVRGSTTGRMNYSDQTYAIGRGIGAIRGINGYPTVYVRAVLERNLERLLVAATGSTFPNVGKDLLNNFEVDVCSPEQAQHANTLLVALEDKRYLNSQTNQTLEQMAQAIFKSWFVDFEPVKAKMNGEQPEGIDAATASLFPEKLVESELGLIPDGWELTNIGKVSECFDKKRIPLSKRQREQKQGSIPYYGATSVMDYVDEAIFDDIYLLIGEDGSVMKDDGTPFIQYIWGPAWVNNHAHVLQGIKSISTEQLMLFFQQTNINAYVTGAVQLKINQRNMNSIPFIKAPKEINERFYDVVAPLYAKIRAIKEENEQLAKLRDTLLPKLLSGEIELGTSEELVEAS